MFGYVQLEYYTWGTMSESSEPSRLSHAREALSTTKTHAVTETSRTDMGLAPWLLFRSTVEAYLQDFRSVFPDVDARIRGIKKQVEDAGRKMLIVDIGGVLDATSIGAETICITLTDPYLDEVPGRSIIVGDILSKGVLKKVLTLIEQKGGSVDLVFFNPRGGASLYAHNPVAYGQIERVFESCVPYLSDFGEIYGGVQFDTRHISFGHLPASLSVEQRSCELPEMPGRRLYAFRMHQKTVFSE